MMAFEWMIVNSGILPASEIMERDASLLKQMDHRHVPIIHLYEWQRECLTFGYFVNPSKYLHEENLKKHGLEIARRPTGGGIIFHLSDFAFSVLIPSNHPFYSSNTLQCYRAINERVALAVEQCCTYSPTLLATDMQDNKKSNTFCMEQATVYDLILNGKKAGGAAQRKTKNGLLHQGSLSLSMPPFEVLQEVLIEGEASIAKMRQNSFYLFGEHIHSLELLGKRAALREALIQTMKAVL